jgi:hypothetical protein
MTLTEGEVPMFTSISSAYRCFMQRCNRLDAGASFCLDDRPGLVSRNITEPPLLVEPSRVGGIEISSIGLRRFVDLLM